MTLVLPYLISPQGIFFIFRAESAVIEAEYIVL